MSDIESNTNSVVEDRSKFFLGEELNKSEAQTQINTEGADSVYESKYGLYFDKIWIDGSHSNLDKSTTSTSSTSTTSSSTSSSSTSSSSAAAADTTTTTSDLDLAPEVEKLEASAGKLETAADELKAEHDNAAVDKFEAAAGKVARAAEEVRENPTDENAIEELETAADELKNAAHALEGEIGDEKYEKISSAVDAFETATDHLLAADDGEADMAGAVSKATTALDTLVDATAGAEVAADVDTAVDPYQELDTLSDKLNSLTSGLMDKFSIAELDAYEEATELLEEAIDAFIADPTSEASIEGLEKAADALKNATDALDGKIDAGTYKDVSAAVTAFEEVVDKLAGLDGLQSEVDAVAAEIVTALKEVVRATKEGIEGDSAIVTTTVNANDDTSATEDTTTDTTTDTGAESDAVEVNPLLNGLEQATDDLKGFSDGLGADTGMPELVAFETATVKLETAANNLLADPSQENIDAFEVAADDLKAATHALEGKIDDSVYQQAVTAVDDFEAAVDLAIGYYADGDTAETDAQITLATSSLQSLADIVEDAVTVEVEAGVADTTEANPVSSELKEAINGLKSISDGLGANTGIPEIAAFETATVNLERAGNAMLADPSQANIDAFEAASDELKAATYGLEGKIDDALYQDITTAVDDFESAVNLAVTYAAEGDTDKMNEQITLATSSLENMADLVKDAITPAEVDPVEANPVSSELKAAINGLKSISDGLGANTGIPEIAAFETATVNLERAGNAMLADPSQANIDAFETASDELKAATKGLEGKIDDTLYQEMTTVVNDFASAVDLAIEKSEAGDIDGMNEQITLATSNLQSLTDLVKEAITPADATAQAGGTEIDDADREEDDA